MNFVWHPSVSWHKKFEKKESLYVSKLLKMRLHQFYLPLMNKDRLYLVPHRPSPYFLRNEFQTFKDYLDLTGATAADTVTWAIQALTHPSANL